MSRRAPDLNQEGGVVHTSDWRLRDIGRQIEAVRAATYSRGPVFTPETSVSEIISTLHKGGGIALLGEGTWDFADGYVMGDDTRTNITLMSVAPGRTVFRRTKATSDPMLHLKGTEHRVIGIRFDDDNSTGPAVRFDDSRCEIINCVAESVYQLVEVNSADWCVIAGNRVISARNRGVYLNGRCQGCIIRDNIFESCTADDVYLDDSAVHAVIMGNNFYNGGTISYKSPGTGVPGSTANNATDSGSDTVQVGLNNLNAVLAANVTER